MEETAKYILDEYCNNAERFVNCLLSLKGMVSNIPMELANGRYKKGNKFINTEGLSFQGTLLPSLVVSSNFTMLAHLLGCTEIKDIHYDDIDIEIEYVSDGDIQDLKNQLSFGKEILKELLHKEIVSDDQIEKFNLINLVDISYYINDEDFPLGIKRDLQTIQNNLVERFKNDPNPYIKKTRFIFEPQNFVGIDRNKYTINLYKSRKSKYRCFCQMCQKSIPVKYIERRKIQQEPKYEWEEMYLSLCLNCGKDYEILRSEKGKDWEEFWDEILKTKITNERVLKIKIGKKELVFMPEHLMAIQTILKIEKENN